MARNQRKGGRRPRRKPKKKGLSFGSLSVQLASVLAIVFLVFFLIAAKIISNITGALLCMFSLSLLSYFIVNSPKKPRRRRRLKKKKPNADEPQFYTALPSTVGLTDIPDDFSASEVKLPPRPTRSARRQREFVMYPPSVGGGDYSDSYVQVDKDTVLRLRSEMTPESESKYLPGLRIDSLPSSKIAAVMSQAVVPSVEPVEAPVVAEAVPVVAETVAESTETPVVQSAVVQEDEDEEEQMDFDMEWD